MPWQPHLLVLSSVVKSRNRSGGGSDKWSEIHQQSCVWITGIFHSLSPGVYIGKQHTHTHTHTHTHSEREDIESPESIWHQNWVRQPSCWALKRCPEWMSGSLAEVCADISRAHHTGYNQCRVKVHGSPNSRVLQRPSSQTAETHTTTTGSNYTQFE